MPTTFGRLGRAMLVIGAVALVVGLVGLVTLNGTPQFVVCLVAAIVAAVMLVNGATWTVLQRRMFGSPAALARAAGVPVATNAVIVSVTPTSARMNNDPVMFLGLQVGAETVERRVTVPLLHLTAIRPGATLPVRLDPEGTKAMVVDWTAVPY